MCQALMEIMEPHLQLREKAGMKEGIKEGINGAVDTLRAFGHGDLEIKNAIMQRYVLSLFALHTPCRSLRIFPQTISLYHNP